MAAGSDRDGAAGGSGQTVTDALIGGHNVQIGYAGGDVLIMLDRPEYRLEFLEPIPMEALHVPRSQRLPSYLLDPQRQVVPFHPRPREQQALEAWRDEPEEPVSLLLLYGPGGQGKTRLASRFASESHRGGWAVAQAVERTPGLRAGRGLPPGLSDGQPLLVVVDYAERWRLPLLVHLVDNLLLDYPDRRVRVLLLSRPAGASWDRMAAELRHGWADVAEPVVLGEFARGTSEREEAFAEAATAFSAAIGADVELPPPPADLMADAYRSPLTLHMAALAAVHARKEGRPSPASADLSQYLLDHERRYWTAAEADPATGAVGLAPGAMERVVFLATLLGPVGSISAGRALLRRAKLADGDAEVDRLLTAHGLLYPAAASAESSDGAGQGIPPSGSVLGPLRPDRLGEDFVGRYLTREPAAAEMVLLPLTDVPYPSVATRRCLIVLTAAAERHPVARSVLFDLLRDQPDLVSHAAAPVVELVVRDAPDSIARVVDGALPLFSTELLASAHDLARRLLDALPADAPLEERARRLAVLGMRQSNLGRREQALAAMEEAVGIYRRLASANPAAFEPDLARALSNLSIARSNLNRREQALAATEEAVGIYRRLAAANPAAFGPERLAGALNNLSVDLSNLGRRKEALAATEEAVEIYRRLAVANPVAFEPDLAMALNNHGIRLSDLGRREQALAATEEAVEIYRRLMAANPATFEHDLARALNTLSVGLSNLGRREQALAAIEEAVEIRRRQAGANPAAFEPDLARALTNLFVCLSDLGRPEEALAATEEAVEIRRRLVAANPAAFEPELATALNNLSVGLADLGRREQALAAIEEAVEIRRRQAGANPAAFEPDLARALAHLGTRRADLGRREEALAATEEAVEIRRRLVATNPAAFEPDLALALANLGTHQADLGRREEALAATEEAVEIRRRLLAANPAAFEPDLAVALTNLGARLSDVGRRKEALAAMEEAVEIYRRLADQLPVLISSLRIDPRNLADALAEVARRAEAGGLRRSLAQSADEGC